MCSSVSIGRYRSASPNSDLKLLIWGIVPGQSVSAGLLGPRLVRDSLPRLVDRTSDLGLAVDAHGHRQNRYGS